MNTYQEAHTALITGASAGIGLALTRRLLSEGWQVIALNRSAYPADDASIQEAVADRRLRVYNVTDLADFTDLKRILQDIRANEQQIDILFNNAGGSLNELYYSKQGREKHYELMTVVPFIILMELKELLKNGRLKTVINTSSSALKFTKEFSLENLERPKTFRKLLGPYAASKLALSLWSQAIAPQLAKDGIKIRSVDPGSNNTLRSGKKSGLPVYIIALMKLTFPPPTHGAGKLYEGALGKHRHETGVFIRKDQVSELIFADQAENVLDKMHAIYEHEFAQLSV